MPDEPDRSSRSGGGARTFLVLAVMLAVSLALGAYLWFTRDPETPRDPRGPRSAPPAGPRMTLREAEECFRWPERELAGHEGQVLSVAFSPDGKRSLSGGLDGTLRLWDLATGTERRKLTGHGSTVRSVAFSPDGQRVLSGGADGTLRLWELEHGRPIRTFELPEREGVTGRVVFSVAFSPDGRAALSAGWWQEGEDKWHAELLLWRLPNEFGYRLLGTQEP